MLPNLFFTFEYPDVLNDTQGVQRLHNKVGKEALRLELINHHKKRLPLHFDQNNRSKYNHKPRKEKYKYAKYIKYRSATDLVASGRTKQAMTKSNPTPVIGGTASGASGLSGKIKYRFPFTQTEKFQQSQKKRYSKKPQERKRVSPGVTIEQMRKEISTINTSEQREIAASLKERYAKLLAKELKNRPKMKKYIKG